MSQSTTPLLDTIQSPADVKKLTIPQLEQLAAEIRQELIHKLAKTGGHLGPNLGVVELTVALHRVFSTPQDKFVWDVSHQIYVHKLLTGRKSRFHTIRTTGGLSGFALRIGQEFAIICPVFEERRRVYVHQTDCPL